MASGRVNDASLTDTVMGSADVQRGCVGETGTRQGQKQLPNRL